VLLIHKKSQSNLQHTVDFFAGMLSAPPSKSPPPQPTVIDSAILEFELDQQKDVEAKLKFLEITYSAKQPISTKVHVGTKCLVFMGGPKSSIAFYK
jgi:hypothetical protein